MKLLLCLAILLAGCDEWGEECITACQARGHYSSLYVGNPAAYPTDSSTCLCVQVTERIKYNSWLPAEK